MRKQGQLKLQRHRTKVQKQNHPQSKPQADYSSESESSSEEWADMLDEGEQQYILNRLSKQPQLLSNIPDTEEQKTKCVLFFIFARFHIKINLHLVLTFHVGLMTLE